MSDQSSNGKSKSILEGFKSEWSLFWETLTGEDESKPVELQEDPFETGQIEMLTFDQVRAITKALSQDKRKLNQKMESTKKEIDLNSAKLESLKLVGSDTDDTEARITELHEVGRAITHELVRIDERLKRARLTEKQIQQNTQDSDA